jgi:hypothetical protein
MNAFKTTLQFFKFNEEPTIRDQNSQKKTGKSLDLSLLKLKPSEFGLLICRIWLHFES